MSPIRPNAVEIIGRDATARKESRGTLGLGMPFLAYVHARRPDPDPEPGGGRAWEPDWRVWRPVGLALLAGFAASSADDAAQALLALVAFTLVCVAVSRLLPDGDGLRDWRQ